MAEKPKFEVRNWALLCSGILGRFSLDIFGLRDNFPKGAATERWRDRMLKKVLTLMTATVISSNALAGMEGDFTVISTLQDTQLYGGCMARLSGGSGAIQSLGYDCPADPMVTFDCKGVLGGSKSDGIRNFDAAQLALVTGATIRVHIDDTKKINNFCYSRRVDVFQ